MIYFLINTAITDTVARDNRIQAMVDHQLVLVGSWSDWKSLTSFKASSIVCAGYVAWMLWARWASTSSLRSWDAGHASLPKTGYSASAAGSAHRASWHIVIHSSWSASHSQKLEQRYSQGAAKAHKTSRENIPIVIFIFMNVIENGIDFHDTLLPVRWKS